MTAPNAFRKSDIRRAADLVKETGLVVELERDGQKFRVMPNIPAINRADEVPKAKDVRL